MICREYETDYNIFEKVEYCISVTTDSFDVYVAMKDAIESLAEQAEMQTQDKGDEDE